EHACQRIVWKRHLGIDALCGGPGPEILRVCKYLDTAQFQPMQPAIRYRIAQAHVLDTEEIAVLYPVAAGKGVKEYLAIVLVAACGKPRSRSLRAILRYPAAKRGRIGLRVGVALVQETEAVIALIQIGLTVGD